jgi:hypothetical protein
MKSHSLLNFSVFICALVIGYTFSTRFYHPGFVNLALAGSVAAAEEQSSISALSNGQRTFLVITVNSLKQTDPQLESIWLASYLPDNPNIQLLPVYSSTDEIPTRIKQQLASTFSLNNHAGITLLDRDFLDLLEANNYWWSGYIVLDEQALQDLATAIFGQEGTEISPDILLLSACQYLTANRTNNSASQLAALISQRAASDLEPVLLQQEIKRLFSGKRPLTCSFPAAEVSEIVH